MNKKYYIWILLGLLIIIGGIFLISRNSEAPSKLPATDQTKNSDTVNIDLENDADFEQDADDLNINEEVPEDIDSSDFDENAIDDNVF